MASTAAVGIGGSWLDVLKRRSTLQQIFRFTRIGVIIACAILLLLIIMQVINSYLELDANISKLENDVQNSILNVEASMSQSGNTPNYRQIARNKPFGELKPRNVIESKPTEKLKPVSNVPLNLVGTFVTRGEEPYAIIEDKKKKEQEIFVIGDSIFDAATLTDIFSTHVEIKRNGVTEILKLDDTPEGSGSGRSDAAGDVVNVNEDELDKALDNLPLLLTQARAVPYFKDGKSIGLRLFAIKRDSLYEKIGLKNGDILKSINGNSLGDITQAVKLFEKLREERSIDLTLERNRAEKVIRYEIR